MISPLSILFSPSMCSLMLMIVSIILLTELSIESVVALNDVSKCSYPNKITHMIWPFDAPLTME
jgi:hypothetical protein